MNLNVQEKSLLHVFQVRVTEQRGSHAWYDFLCLEAVTAEDLNQYFKRFGEVTDVYIPRPSRSFAFVTFLESSIVPSLYGDHFINGSVIVTRRSIDRISDWAFVHLF